MDKERLRELAALTNENELRRAMHELLLPFGGAKQISIVIGGVSGPHRCFVELNSAEHNLAVKDALGGTDFGEVILIQLPRSMAKAA